MGMAARTVTPHGTALDAWYDGFQIAESMSRFNSCPYRTQAWDADR